MRNIFSLSLFVSLFTFAQTATVSVNETSGAEGQKITLSFDSYYLNFEQQVPEGEGASEMVVELERPELIDVQYGDNLLSVYLAPGDKLAIVADPTAEELLQFEGDASTENEFLQAFYAIYGDDFDDDKMKTRTMETGIDQFEMNLFSANDTQTKMLDSAEGLSTEFEALMRNEIRYNYLHRLLAYPILRGNATTKPFVDPLPNVMLDVVNEDWVMNEEAMNSPAYRGFLNYHVVYQTSVLNDYKKFTGYDTSLEKKYFYARENLEGEPLNFFISKWLTENFQRVKPSTCRFLFGTLEDPENKNRYHKAVQTILGDQLTKEDPEEEVLAAVEETGPSAVDAMFTDMEGKPVDLDDYKGKVVYVDFWASWCGPCRVQMPKSKELHDRLSKKQQKQVVFLYISIDDTEAKWKGAIEKMGIEGEHLLSKGGWSSKACRRFRISSIPRYMLIDKEGIIVEPNAPRPGDPSMFDRILELL